MDTSKKIASGIAIIAVIVLVVFLIGGNNGTTTSIAPVVTGSGSGSRSASGSAVENFSQLLPHNTPTSGTFASAQQPNNISTMSPGISAKKRRGPTPFDGSPNPNMVSGCGRDTLTATDLLPSGDSANSEFALANPTSGSADTVNYLTAGGLIGGATRTRNLTNFQMRPDPVIPKRNVSPWLQSSLESDPYDTDGKSGYWGGMEP